MQSFADTYKKRNLKRQTFYIVLTMETWSYDYLHYVLEQLYDEIRYERKRAKAKELEAMYDYETKLCNEIKRRQQLGIRDPPNWCDGDDDWDWECECPVHTEKRSKK